MEAQSLWASVQGCWRPVGGTHLRMWLQAERLTCPRDGKKAQDQTPDLITPPVGGDPGKPYLESQK